MKAKISIILRVAVSIGFIGFLLWTMKPHFSRIADTLSRTNLLLFSLGVGLFSSNVILFSVRLQLLFAGEGLKVPFGRVIQLSYIGFFFNNFMPTAVGGDIVKAYYSYRQTGEAAKSFIAVFMDRFIGLFSFVAIGALALLLSWKEVDIVLKKIVLIFAICGVAGFLVILNSTIANILFKIFSKIKVWNLGERLSKVYKAVHEYTNKKRLILAVMGVSAVSQCIYFTVIYILAKSLGTNPLLLTVFMIMPVVSVVTMMPSLGGLGLREGAILALFGPVIGSDNAFALSVLVLATLLVTSLIGGLIYATASQFRIKAKEMSKMKGYSI